MNLKRQNKMSEYFFLNDRFIVLKTIYENQVTIGENQFTPVTQEELANLAQFSKAKVNKLLNELMDGGYVIMFNGIKSTVYKGLHRVGI